jgi:predicted alpha/beta superfamily hydrolase
LHIPDAAPPKDGYRILWLLDGNASFPIAAHALRGLERRAKANQMIPTVVVGIGYPTMKDYETSLRQRDYLPSQQLEDELDEDSPVGRADTFLQFIQTTLTAVIAEKFSVNTQFQGIVGHSFGGLFVLNGLLNKPDAFRYYFAISPSLWWGQGALHKRHEKADLSKASFETFISVGSEEDAIDPKDKVRAKKLLSRAMVNNARSFHNRLVYQQTNQQKNNFRLYDNADHGSVVYPAIVDAVHRIAMP